MEQSWSWLMWISHTFTHSVCMHVCVCLCVCEGQGPNVPTMIEGSDIFVIVGTFVRSPWRKQFFTETATSLGKKQKSQNIYFSSLRLRLQPGLGVGVGVVLISYSNDYVYGKTPKHMFTKLCVCVCACGAHVHACAYVCVLANVCILWGAQLPLLHAPRVY